MSENYFLNAKIIISLNKKAPKQREEFQAFWKNNGCGGAKSVMNDLKNRGVNDVYVFCVDGLAGFREAINAAFPKSQVQRCIIHQIRSSTKYVSYKDIKSLMSNLKKVYQAVNEDEALNALIDFKEKWQKSYPSCVRSLGKTGAFYQRFLHIPPRCGR